MIYKIWADDPRFKVVEFQPGFNVVTAEKTKESDPKDSRNGLGKTSLFAIIHFLLGSPRLALQRASSLEDWTFYGHFNIGGYECVVSRRESRVECQLP